MDDHTLDPNTGDLRRIEVITGTGRRRSWSAETKAQIIVESFTGEASVSEVARRHGLRPQQLFGWRHYARNGQLAVNSGDPPAFVPMITDGATAAASCAAMASSAIEIEVAGMIVRVRGRVVADALVEVLAVVERLGRPESAMSGRRSSWWPALRFWCG
jgi:transposase